MGWVLLAVFTFDAGRWSSLAASGAVMVTVASSLGTGALFAVIGMVHARTGRRELRYLGGLWRTMPKLGAMGMFFVLAAMALPALGTFVGEVLVLGAVVKVSFTTAAVAAGGLVMSVVYALWMVQKVFQGPEPSMEETDVQERDLDAREWLILAPAVAAMLWLGLFPGSVLDRVKPALDRANSHQPLADTEANSQQPIANRESQAATLTAAFPHRLGFCARHEDLPSALPSVPRSVPADVLFAGSAVIFPPRRGKEDLAGGAAPGHRPLIDKPRRGETFCLFRYRSNRLFIRFKAAHWCCTRTWVHSCGPIPVRARHFLRPHSSDLCTSAICGSNVR